MRARNSWSPYGKTPYPLHNWTTQPKSQQFQAMRNQKGAI
ncbi:BZ3500_MvSof-1268-A1-R1_Chr10-2g02954 [Microbotryum saponariae]|uniref:BZ3500_MvSof-1268-A1-R1_Chr10-2g02954 protein n=1 Tax=Microbotryum saponariae TaxID=289078 RepID=A0A2X0K7D3_9BASI|nr:BZ3501_MvSof-1269-A2-R1_Chr10-2g02540 [Microbotryum saponariae]SDA01813.1 BZ3500_MvSof-1268-A1-R1_Chr10-2g02954 [Microbotryum saponariae]